MSSRSLTTDLRGLGRRAVAAVRAAPAWLGGILTGLQGLALSYLAVLAPSLAVAASAPQDGVGGADWTGATSVATSLWLLGHGVPAEVGGTVVALIPLGLTVLNGAILAALARRFAARTWGSWVLAVATYAVGVGAVASAVGASSQGTHAVTAVAVAVAVAAVGVAIGIWRAHGADLSALARVPAWARAGLRRGAAIAALAVMLAAVAGTAWAVVARHAIGDAATALGLDAVSAGVLAIAELAYVPTLIVWMVAWLTGQGFAVGLGTHYSPSDLTVDALPTVPLLGALPSASGGLLVWVPVVLALAALAVRVAVRRPALSWRQDLAADAVAAGTVGLVMATAFIAASGAAGPGRLEAVGPDALAATAAMLALAAAGLALGAAAVRAPAALGARRDRDGAPRSREGSTAS
ncbi:cell division protein PerM [Demequina muriae]|uniref:DUF6350 family protein n=1 Tax=Demequina muriae TaxID=3051664 RepID=A0ABT8GJ04_9MICO|nr:DUF6350 family protein [Demequina sp. EGI L300058]MDN4480931.1 DUF6350 family protein [Demequina sp. EGI L300058]